MTFLNLTYTCVKFFEGKIELKKKKDIFKGNNTKRERFLKTIKVRHKNKSVQESFQTYNMYRKTIN